MYLVYISSASPSVLFSTQNVWWIIIFYKLLDIVSTIIYSYRCLFKKHLVPVSYNYSIIWIKQFK